jgi:glycosyltransferase involved in cell wall biosynthesis
MSGLGSFANAFSTNGYFIKDGYHVRETANYFADTLTETEGIVHQPEVYPLAAEILRVLGGNTLIDLGCGRAQKLAQMHPEFDVIGVDFGENLQWCQNHYSFGTWLEHNFDHSPLTSLGNWNLERAALICSDIIEHLVRPEFLLETAASLLERAPFILFSTPERDLVRGPDDMGPPINPHHIREWNLAEFRDLLASSGMDIWASGLTVNNDYDWKKRSIAAIARRKGWRATRIPDDFRVLAIICAFNEEDVIEHTLDYLIRQGIQVVLVDNWSTDQTVTKARSFLNKGLLHIESFPDSGPSTTYDWYDLLRRVEQVAADIDTDWVIHHDADEIREGPWHDLTLKEALYQVDQEGYNCVNHTCIVFPPTLESEVERGRIPDAFRYFEFGQRPGHLLQRKAWKKQGQRVNLADSGGHDVVFADRRVYPLRFLLRHYPIRSQRHGLTKVLKERIARLNLFERERGWHTQYDFAKTNPSFLRMSHGLFSFDPRKFNDEFLAERLACVGLTRNDQAFETKGKAAAGRT